ncbi:hypothetical protein M2175_001251 [Bradyrhizobium elkanii]|uniref:DUF7024 domain-containing protein n=1 Tax=Bradyrhizobium TaxID=374 RepID=UPI0021697DA2|nr:MULTISPECIES: hypothetical protein [Bradyrhizobium]MCS3926220.1 hypothetical protein [Bradyrhizobium elkanii]MCS3966772.1 hypothetical protein [Bradyrhizobium japonicum]
MTIRLLWSNEEFLRRVQIRIMLGRSSRRDYDARSIQLLSIVLRPRQLALWLLMAVAILSGSFFGTLRLIDRFLPGLGYDIARFPRMERGQPLTFQNGENRGALVLGWSSPEPWGAWSDGDRAELGFVVASAPREHPKLLIECRAFITQRSLEQRIEFWSQSVKLSEVTLRKDTNVIPVPLGGLHLNAGSPLIIELRMPLAKSPQQLALSQDPRKLAIGLVSARYEEGSTHPL